MTNLNKIIVEIQKSKDSISCVPMDDGSILYKITSGDRVLIENISKEQAINLMDKAKNRVLID